ncbi:MAG: BamA/TamA family outer membrane protein [candidate division KSB1 bacterium]|nr:BamA/TamA family outer membrane protein [candidate division KSB1 bacterium]
MKLRLCIILLLLISMAGLGQAQFFGKNKVQYDSFNWHYLQTEHFDIYFTDGGDNIAEFTANVAENSYIQLQQDLNYKLTDRIKLIIYNSHNDFAQTNVTSQMPEESVGGFTEFFKNRVVLPYEGEWEKFRHVIHHELTHAVMLQMLYGSGTQSIISGLMQFAPPLWMIEGLAEWQSRRWDIESDMFMRDATVSGYVPEVQNLNYYMAYKGGQSVLKYISETYGNEKISEILYKAKANKDFNRALKQAIGIDMEELTERWHLYLKREYWPDIADRKEPDEFADKITKHEEWRNFVNTSPVMSNQGDKLAFISDKDDYFDIYLASTIDGKILKKLVRGQRSGNLESLNWLRGRQISWSPDDRKIVFSAKTGAEDQLHLVNVENGHIVRSIDCGMDGIYNPAWSPAGDEIAFLGLLNGHGDIYVYHLETDVLRKLTDDVFSNVEPAWAPDGGKLAFASDRPAVDTEIQGSLPPMDMDFKDFDIYEINADGTGLKKISGSEHQERAPFYSPDGATLAYTSNRSGVNNIYLYEFSSGDEWPVTNVLTSVHFPSWGGTANRMAFAAFYRGGYDIFIMKHPFSVGRDEIDIKKTGYVTREKTGQLTLSPIDVQDAPAQELKSRKDTEKKYRNYVFDRDFAQGNLEFDEESVFLDSSEYISDSGDYKVNDYEVKYSTDLVYGNVGYDQYFGTTGYTQIMLSDVLGDHRINVGLNLYGDLKNADYAISYYHLKNKMDIGGGIYHNAYFFYSYQTGWVRDRNYGLSISANLPFSRYKRMSFGTSLRGISRSYMDLPDEVVDEWVDKGYISGKNRYFWLSSLSYTKDNTVWKYTGPMNGTRWGVGVTFSPEIMDYGLDFTTLRADWRHYMPIVRDYTLTLRTAGGVSFGKHAQKFFLGGTSNWINYNYRGGIRVENVEEIYFSSFEMPLRGAPFYALEGTRFLLSNIEFRFPFVRYMQLGFPPIRLGNLRGAAFLDMGLAWDKDESVGFRNDADSFSLFKKAPNGLVRADDLFASIGLGLRVNLGMFLLKVDYAWPTDFYSTESNGNILWSLGADF